MNKYMQTFFELLPEKQNTSAALGFFDGLHIGHRKVIGEAVRGSENGLVPICFTFAQSPKSVLKNQPQEALMSVEDKKTALSEIGIQHLYMCDFKSVVDVAPRKFVEDMLIKTLKAKKLCCGFNYTFGKNGEGNTELLAEICKENGIELQVLPPVEEKEGVVSSTLIRELIKDGNMRRANELLGSYFGFGGEVVHGQHLGRELGTPTLNQSLHEELVVPKFGVYASCVTLDDGRKFCGVTNIGVKPTVGNFAPLCETWMPDYSGEELYGKTVDVRLIDFIRGEKKFSSLAADYERLASYRESLWSALDPGIFARISPKDGTPYILTVSARGLRGEILLHLADDRGLIIGTGSACSSNEKSRYSHVVLACGYDKITADGVLRLSFSPATTKEETERAAQILNACARELLERTK